MEFTPQLTNAINNMRNGKERNYGKNYERAKEYTSMYLQYTK